MVITRGSDSASNLSSNKEVTLPFNTATPPDPQVKASRQYAKRRKFDAAYKRRMVNAFEACQTSAERGELLRREGLYHSRLNAWKREFTLKQSHKKEVSNKTVRIDHLSREVVQLKKKLAQAEAVIELQKKYPTCLGRTSSHWRTTRSPHECNH